MGEALLTKIKISRQATDSLLSYCRFLRVPVLCQAHSFECQRGQDCQLWRAELPMWRPLPLPGWRDVFNVADWPSSCPAWKGPDYPEMPSPRCNNRGDHVLVHYKGHAEVCRFPLRASVEDTMVVVREKFGPHGLESCGLSVPMGRLWILCTCFLMKVWHSGSVRCGRLSRRRCGGERTPPRGSSGCVATSASGGRSDGHPQRTTSHSWPTTATWSYKDSPD